MMEAGKYYKIIETEVIYQNLQGDFMSGARWNEDIYIAEISNDDAFLQTLLSYKKRENVIEIYFHLSEITIIEDEMVKHLDSDKGYDSNELTYVGIDAFLRPISQERLFKGYIKRMNESEIKWFTQIVSEEASFQLELDARHSA